MKKLKHLLLAVSVVFVGSLATTQAQLPGGLVNDSDITFLRETSQRNAFEILGGQLPNSHSNLAVVKRFGNRITRNNNRDSQQLRNIALRLGVSISLQPSTTQTSDLSGYGQLFNGNFNRVWLNKEIRTILDDIRSSLTVINDGSNLQVRAFARRRLPTLLAELQAGIFTAQQIGLPLD